jgi:hypothetical protein
MAENAWSTGPGRAALAKILCAGEVESEKGLRSVRDFARQWLVERGWIVTCSKMRGICYHWDSGRSLENSDYDVALIAGIEATKEPTDGNRPGA